MKTNKLQLTKIDILWDFVDGWKEKGIVIIYKNRLVNFPFHTD